ncbi:MAG TPA: MBL fold metallo-hydrolase [Candidatus Cybelea sp.]
MHPAYGWDDAAVADKRAIDDRVPAAELILVTHTHYDHVLDVPGIALGTHAMVIGTESTQNLMRAYDVLETQLLRFEAARIKSPHFKKAWEGGTFYKSLAEPRVFNLERGVFREISLVRIIGRCDLHM